MRCCTESPNNLVSRDAKINATAMTAKEFFERLYLVPGLHQLLPFVTMPSKPTFPPLAWRLFLDFRAIFFVRKHDSPSYLSTNLVDFM